MYGERLLRSRHHAGLSQAQLAKRCGTSQSAIARLELGSSNATVATLVRVAAAAGFAITVDLIPLPTPDPVIARYKQDVDRASLRENRKRTVDQRLRSLGEWQLAVRELERATRAARSQTGPRRWSDYSPRYTTNIRRSSSSATWQHARTARRDSLTIWTSCTRLTP